MIKTPLEKINKSIEEIDFQIKKLTNENEIIKLRIKKKKLIIEKLKIELNNK